jgi:acetylglutamate kinase
MKLSNAERAEVLTQALPYIQKYNGKILVVKYGGNAMINDDLRSQVMEDIVLLTLIGVKIVLVHGGGPEMSDTMGKMGKKPEFVDGLRVTDRETADIALMVLAGKINKTLVNLLQMNGGRAMGICGMDGRLIEARMKDERLGYVGEITDVNPEAHRGSSGKGLHSRGVHSGLRPGGPHLQHKRRHRRRPDSRSPGG